MYRISPANLSVTSDYIGIIGCTREPNDIIPYDKNSLLYSIMITLCFQFTKRQSFPTSLEQINTTFITSVHVHFEQYDMLMVQANRITRPS